MRNFPEILRSLRLGEGAKKFIPGDNGERDQVLATEASPQTSSSAEAAPKQPSASDRLRKIAQHERPTTYLVRTLNFPDSAEQEMSRKS